MPSKSYHLWNSDMVLEVVWLQQTKYYYRGENYKLAHINVRSNFMYISWNTPCEEMSVRILATFKYSPVDS